MEEFIVAVACRDEDLARKVCSLVNLAGARCRCLESAAVLELEGQGCTALVAELDGQAMSQGYFSRLAAAHPGIKVIVLSRSTSHPELKEALRSNIFSCLRLPLKEEELQFCLRSLLRASAKLEEAGDGGA